MFEPPNDANLSTTTSRLDAARIIMERARHDVLEVLVCCRLSAEQRELLESAEQSLDDIYLPGIIEQLELAGFDQDLSGRGAEPIRWASSR